MSQDPTEPAGGRQRRRVKRRVRVDESGRPLGRWHGWRKRGRRVVPAVLLTVVFLAGLAGIWVALRVLVKDPPMAADVEPLNP